MVYLKGSPTGLIQSIMCKLLRTRSIKYENIASAVSVIPLARASSANALRT